MDLRDAIEAGIKEGKNVFQMHHLKVRSPQALLLQEHFACFAANFVRFAAHWLAERQAELPTSLSTDPPSSDKNLSSIPVAEADPAPQMQGMPQNMPSGGQASDLPALFQAWGIFPEAAAEYPGTESYLKSIPGATISLS